MAKSEALRQLETLAFQQLRERYPNTPVAYLPKCTYSDKTANGLTKCIIDYLRLNGCHAERINTMGVPMDKRKVVTDCIGRKRQIGSLTWRKSTSTRGSADIHCLVNGRAIFIEVKANGDRMRPEQWEYKKQVEAAGGVFLIATSFENFLNQYMELV